MEHVEQIKVISHDPHPTPNLQELPNAVLDPQPQATTMPPMQGELEILKSIKESNRAQTAQGSLSSKEKGDPRGGTVAYEPFKNASNLKRFLRDLSLGVLSGKLYPRQASTIRSCIGMWLRLSEYEKIPELEKRIQVLEAKAR